MLTPIPQECVTAKMNQKFNESIDHVGSAFTATGQTAQKKFHSERVAYDRMAGP